jgi:hypothetical protein
MVIPASLESPFVCVERKGHVLMVACGRLQAYLKGGWTVRK